MKTIIKYIKPYLGRMSLGLLIKVVGTLMDLAIPYLLSYIIDNIIETGNWKDVCFYGAIMIICAIIGFTGNVLANRMAIKVAKLVTTDLRHDLFSKTENLSYRQIDQVTIPSLISRLSSDTYNVHQMVGMMQRIGVRAPILLIGGIIVTFTLDVKLALILMATLPLIVIIVFIITKTGIPLYTDVQKSIDELTRTIRENASGARVIKALSKKDYEKEKFSKVNKHVFDVEIKSGIIMSKLNPLVNLVLNLGLVAVIIVGSIRVNIGDSEVGVIIAFTSYFTIILNAMISITRIFMVYSRSSASANRIQYIFDLEDDLQIEDIPAKSTPYHIEFNDVNFSYNKVLYNIERLNLKLMKGQKCGIIGSTGAGKTTIVNLLMRFYDVDEGEILINGRNIKSIENQTLKNMFGVVFQNDMVFNDTIFENVSFGRNLSIEQVKKACEYAQASDFIEALPDKYNTVLTPSGTNVSGGQKQRILIARSLASHPDILIFDDATSALDYKTDSLVRKVINEEFTATTTIIITQRVSSIKSCDIIMVVDDGKIIDMGSHQELIKSSKVYNEIYTSQMGGAINE